MKFEVVWTGNGFATFEAIYKRILMKWGEHAASRFETKVDYILDLLEKSPSSFQSSREFPKLKKVLISKQTTLYFEINHQEVVLLAFWENAMDPDRLLDLLGI